MKKKIIIAAFTVAGLILLKFVFTYMYNEWVITRYDEEDYSENFSLLEMMNFTEQYIVYYNNGNVSYQLHNYDDAIQYYEQALEKDPPEGKECPIRINLALAKLGLLDKDCFSEKKIENTIALLQDCLHILSEDGCATDDGNGHDNRAQRLYDEIKELLQQAEEEQQKQQQQQQNDPSDQSESSDESESNQQNSDQQGSDESNNMDQDQQRQSQIQSQMESMMQQANQNRQNERRKNEAQNKDWNWYYDEEPVW